MSQYAAGNLIMSVLNKFNSPEFCSAFSKLPNLGHDSEIGFYTNLLSMSDHRALRLVQEMGDPRNRAFLMTGPTFANHDIWTDYTDIPAQKTITQQKTTRAEKQKSLRDVLDIIYEESQCSETEKTRTKNNVKKFLEAANLSLGQPVSAVINKDKITEICNIIKKTPHVSGDTKAKYHKSVIQYIKKAVFYSDCKLPDGFLESIQIPKRTPSSQRGTYEPFTKDNLVSIFDPRHDFFNKTPNMFFACIIALITGARRNAALTLQYKDIIKEGEIYCFHFQSDHAHKKFKTDCTNRKVPIHKILLDLGFIEYIGQKKAETRKRDEDFIFDGALTESGAISKTHDAAFTKYLKSIGVKKKPEDKICFHSFRKTASITMQNAKIPKSYINRIIGWEGDTTMEKNYSNHSIAAINKEMGAFNYDFLLPALEEWKRKLMPRPDTL